MPRMLYEVIVNNDNPVYMNTYDEVVYYLRTFDGPISPKKIEVYYGYWEDYNKFKREIE